MSPAANIDHEARAVEWIDDPGNYGEERVNVLCYVGRGRRSSSAFAVLSFRRPLAGAERPQICIAAPLMTADAP